MAAQFVRPDDINFMTRQAGGWICLALTEERCDELGLELMTAKNESLAEHAVHGDDRGRRGRDDRHQHRRPGAHDADRDRPDQERRRHRPARPRAPAQGAQVRRARAPGPHRGGGRPRAAGRAQPGRRDLRDPERGRLDGPRRGPRRVLPQARPEDDHDRRSDRLPAHPRPRAAGRARRQRDAADVVRRVHRRRLSARRSTTSTTWRSSRARSTASPTCSCACTRSA